MEMHHCQFTASHCTSTYMLMRQMSFAFLSRSIDTRQLWFFNKYTGWTKKRGHRLMTIILSNLNWLKKIFSTGRFFDNFAVKWINPTAPCLCCQQNALNDKSQGSVAAYFRCSGVVNNRINKRFIDESVSEKNLKSVNIWWQSYKQERDCPVHFLRLLAVCWPGVQSAWDIRALACNFAKYSSI